MNVAGRRIEYARNPRKPLPYNGHSGARGFLNRENEGVSKGRTMKKAFSAQAFGLGVEDLGIFSLMLLQAEDRL
jgi:hypothetical protein